MPWVGLPSRDDVKITGRAEQLLLGVASSLNSSSVASIPVFLLRPLQKAPIGEFLHDLDADELEDDMPRRKNKAKSKVRPVHMPACLPAPPASLFGIYKTFDRSNVLLTYLLESLLQGNVYFSD